ncbi:MAG: dUTP diphosphatase [Treponema sp.]|jgi:dUTP pyrophosphatase|nr:dUTP diphosphatase [Treponema sp.]
MVRRIAILPSVKVLKDSEGIELPRYESKGASGMDLRAFLENDVVIEPLGRVKIPTGLKIEIPKGYEAQIRPRSGLALKYGITVLNSPGTIDSDYRGPLEIILVNLGNESFSVKNGERVAQLVISKVCRVRFKRVQALSVTRRSQGGFGSTGR